MVARTASWSRQAEPLEAGVAVALAAALFLTSWALLHRGFYTREQIPDTAVYERYGSAVDDGKVPYRDFALEYPPGALPVFVLPALGDADELTYERRFEGLMAVCGLAVVAFAAIALTGLGAGLGRLLPALALIALAPLAIGSLLLSRFDLWPAALTAAALAALVNGRNRLGHGVLGAAAAAKLYPLVLVPVTVAYVWRTRGPREALLCAGIGGAVLAAIVLPFAILSPDGVWDSVSGQASRPLQIESIGSALIIAGHHLFGLDATMESSHGSQNLAGGFPDALAVVQSLLQAGALIAVWVVFARGPATRERLVLACAAALCAFVALGKVLSPQFLVWLVPLVPLIRGRRGLTASALLAACLVLTQLWFPYRYWDFALRFDELASWLVLTRDLLLLGLLGWLLWSLRERDPDELAAGRTA